MILLQDHTEMSLTGDQDDVVSRAFSVGKELPRGIWGISIGHGKAARGWAPVAFRYDQILCEMHRIKSSIY